MRRPNVLLCFEVPSFCTLDPRMLRHKQTDTYEWISLWQRIKCENKYMHMINIYDFKDWNIQTITKSEHIKTILSKTEHQIWFFHLNWNKFKLKQTYKQIYFHPSILIETKLQTNHIWTIHLKTELPNQINLNVQNFMNLKQKLYLCRDRASTPPRDSSVAVEESSPPIHRIDEKEGRLRLRRERSPSPPIHLTNK